MNKISIKYKKLYEKEIDKIEMTHTEKQDYNKNVRAGLNDIYDSKTKGIQIRSWQNG